MDGKLTNVVEGDIIPKAREVEELYLYGKKQYFFVIFLYLFNSEKLNFLNICYNKL